MKRFTAAIAALTLSIFIVSFSVVAVLNFRPAYYLQIPKIAAENPKYTEETIRNNYDILIDYQSPLGPDKLVLEGIPMSDSGEFHFYEVKLIFTKVFWAMAISFLISTAFFIGFMRKRDLRYMRWSGLLTVLIPFTLAIPFILDFSTAFVVFHELAFSNDFWLFDPAVDPIINILPEWFFMQEAFLIIGLILILAVIQLAIGFRKGKDDSISYDPRNYMLK
ncbi:TIGR01906 family membrane protein [Youngiibacter fragilis]|uniref:Membrane protein n=1 Tax=Youngiibacter fragilis 232.1 TaxID=994573 RepID=V7HYE7_9CLOT|nr:TIGR01906 family membrane protein [Youngiibacter fragilis]ETA79005.1 membrane protein [Youngiibacter fragilis 232.1]